MQRRTLLGLGVAGAVALALAGAGAALLLSTPTWRDGRLLPTGRRVLRGVARAVLDGSLSDDPTSQSAALEAHLARMDATLSAMPPTTQREVAGLLTLLATAPGSLALTGLSQPWHEAPVDALQRTLQSMRLSTLGLRRQVYQALRDLTHAAYFADPSTWAQLGYPGPAKVG
ncbi:MAG: hypothetical protein OEV65_17525 [Aquincola sp.]|nr:hypothetical protein [Aquincola sp.]